MNSPADDEPDMLCTDDRQIVSVSKLVTSGVLCEHLIVLVTCCLCTHTLREVDRMAVRQRRKCCTVRLTSLPSSCIYVLVWGLAPQWALFFTVLVDLDCLPPSI